MRLYLLPVFLLLVHASFSQDAWKSSYRHAQDSYQKGNLQESYNLGRRALIQAKMEFGIANDHYADNLRLLTLICYSSSQLQQGIDYALQEISSRQSLEQTASPVYGKALYNLGLLYLAGHTYPLAISYLQNALAIFKNFPQEKESRAQTQYQLGRAYQGQDRWALADSMYRTVVEFAQNDSISRPLLFQARYQQALMQAAQQDHKNLSSLYALKNELEREKDTLNPVYLNTLCLLASKEENEGQLAVAATLYEQARMLLASSSGEMADSLRYAHVLDNLGVLAIAQGNLPKAESGIARGYQIRKRHLQVQDGLYWVSVDHMAQLYQAEGDRVAAVQFYERSVKDAEVQSGQLPYQYIVVLNNLALLYWEDDQYAEATRYYHQALKRISDCDTADVKVQLQKASVFYNVARNYQNLSQFDTAIYYYKKAVDLSKKYAGSKSPEYMATLSGMAALYQDIGYFTEAEIFYHEALQIQEAVSGKESNAYANVLNNFALLVQAKGDYHRAEVLLKEVVSMKKKLLGENDPQTIAVLSNLGLFYLDVANYKEARPLLEKALSIHQQQLPDTDPSLIANLINKARLEIAEAHYTIAEPLLKSAVHIAEVNYADGHPELASARLELATFYLTLGNYPAAAPLLQESRLHLRQLYGVLHPDYAAATQDMAILYEATGQDSLAEALFKETLQIDRQVLGKQHPDYAISLNNLASFYQHIEKDSAALPLLQESLSISQNTFGKEHPSYTATLLNLGLLYQDLGQYEKAEPLVNEVVALRKKMLGEKHPDYAYALYGKAILYHHLGKYEEAASIFHQVVDSYTWQIKSYFPALSEKEKSAFYKRIEPVLNAYRDFVVDLLVNKKEVNSAVSSHALLGELYNVQLITKAMLLDASSKIRKNIFNSGNVQLMQTYRAWRQEKEKLAQAYTLSKKALSDRKINIQESEKKANELEKQLSASSVLFARDMGQKNLTWQDVRRNLKSDEAAVEIIRGYKEKEAMVFYMALLVAPSLDAPDLIVLPEGRKMEGKNYFYYKNGIEFRAKDTLSYDLYWLPIREALPPQVKSVYIAPDGIYNKISLNSLYDVTENKFVLDEVNIRMLSSTRKLVEKVKEEQGGQPRQAYLFGYPNYRYELNNQPAIDSLKAEGKPLSLLASTESEMYPFRYGITLLPGTQREVNYVDDMLHAFHWNTYKFTENVALEENIKQVKNPALLHIATHGYFMSDLPLTDDTKAFGIHLKSMAANPLLRSGLLLAGSERTILASEADEDIVRDRDAEDGILTAYEAMNLDLNGTDLVVLSACETGLGDVRNGEGVYGLQRAFLIAGAKSVMMSLWKVNDLATTELIKKFYYNWLSGQDKFTALRNAQMAIKEAYHDPYYWGAFVLMGK